MRQASIVTWTIRRACPDDGIRVLMTPSGAGSVYGREQQIHEVARISPDPLDRRTGPLLDPHLGRARQLLEPPLSKQLLVDRAQSALEGRVHGRPERDGFPVHGTAGRYDDVRVGHQ